MSIESNLPETVALFREGLGSLHIGVQCYVSRHGQPVAEFALGEARPGVPLTAETLMPWLSASKPLTAIAVAQLWEQDRLQLDEPVASFIPEFAAEGKEGVTVRHLLTHTAGFRTADHLSEELDWNERIARICETPLEPDWSPGQKAGYHLGASWFILNSNCYGTETVPYGYGRHASFDTFGHSGAQSSAAFADPTHQLVVAWVANGLPGEPKHQKRAREINSAIYQDLRLT